MRRRFWIIFLILFGCSSDFLVQSDDARSSNETLAADEVGSSHPSIAAESIGGMPSKSEVASLQTLTSTEAEGVLKEIVLTNTNTTLDLADSGCDSSSGIYCLASDFSGVYDIVTGVTSCLIDLLLTDRTDGYNPLRQLENQDIFFTDGFTDIAITSSGVSCPRHSKVEFWQSLNKVKKAGSSSTGLTDDEVYLTNSSNYTPGRLVITRQNDTYVWKIVLFPADYLNTLAARVSYYDGLKGRDLDFIPISGTITTATKSLGGIDGSKGSYTVDFAELTRLTTILDELDGSSLTSLLPSGTVTVSYDNTASVTHSTTAFQDGFSYGDFNGSTGSPFALTSSIQVYQSDTERHLTFRTMDPLVTASSSELGSYGPVQYCAISLNDFDTEDSPIWETLITEVDSSSYLSDDPEYHVQILWNSSTSATGEPDNYLISYKATQGGAYIYGDVEFIVAIKEDETSTMLRIAAPKCDSMTDAVVTEWEEVDSSSGGPYYLRDSDGYRNIHVSSDGETTWLSKDDLLSLFPTFSKLQLIDATDTTATPVIE